MVGYRHQNMIISVSLQTTAPRRALTHTAPTPTHPEAQTFRAEPRTKMSTTTYPREWQHRSSPTLLSWRHSVACQAIPPLSVRLFVRMTAICQIIKLLLLKLSICQLPNPPSKRISGDLVLVADRTLILVHPWTSFTDLLFSIPEVIAIPTTSAGCV
jgi:hypothetical protein